MSLFVLSSKDGWVNIMYDGLDAVGIDQQVEAEDCYVFFPSCPFPLNLGCPFHPHHHTHTWWQKHLKSTRWDRVIWELGSQVDKAGSHVRRHLYRAGVLTQGGGRKSKFLGAWTWRFPFHMEYGHCLALSMNRQPVFPLSLGNQLNMKPLCLTNGRA